jgi:hypothetical protein
LIKGGKGGANTNLTGLRFEKETSLRDLLEATGYEIVEQPRGLFDLVLKNGHEVGVSAKGAKLYRFLESQGIDHENRISARLLPDEALFVAKSRTLYVIEKKFMSVSGSVDEKPQTADFKKKQYLKLVSGSEISIKFIYVFNSSWWDKPRYKDTFDYIKSVGCDYFFDEIPLKVLELE